MDGQGDLGRRIAERRRALGLSREALAERAGMDPTYVGSVESRAAPLVSHRALRRLAGALETTVGALTGATTQVPPGRRAPSGHPALQPVDREACTRLVAGGGVGRVVLVGERGPLALPVNFRLVGDDVVFRTSSTGTISRSLPAEHVSFEVDHVDEALGEGWSVLLTGTARVVSDPFERAALEALGIAPWAGPDRDAFVRISPSAVTGVRIRHLAS